MTTGECVWQWPTILLLWIVVNCLPMWIVIWRSKKYRPTAEQLSNPRYKAFLRLDAHQMSYLMTVFTHFFFIPKFIIGWLSIAIALSGCLIVSIGLKKGEVAGPIRLTLYSWFLWIGSRTPLLLVGCFWLNHKKVEKCYKKYLGPEWKFDKNKSFEGAGVYVSNH